MNDRGPLILCAALPVAILLGTGALFTYAALVWRDAAVAPLRRHRRQERRARG